MTINTFVQQEAFQRIHALISYNDPNTFATRKLFHKELLADKLNGLAGPRQEVVDTVIEIGRTLDGLPTDFEDPSFAQAKQAIIALAAFFTSNSNPHIITRK